MSDTPLGAFRVSSDGDCLGQNVIRNPIAPNMRCSLVPHFGKRAAAIDGATRDATVVWHGVNKKFRRNFRQIMSVSEPPEHQLQSGRDPAIENREVRK